MGLFSRKSKSSHQPIISPSPSVIIPSSSDPILHLEPQSSSTQASDALTSIHQSQSTRPPRLFSRLLSSTGLPLLQTHSPQPNTLLLPSSLSSSTPQPDPPLSPQLTPQPSPTKPSSRSPSLASTYAPPRRHRLLSIKHAFTLPTPKPTTQTTLHSSTDHLPLPPQQHQQHHHHHQQALSHILSDKLDPQVDVEELATQTVSPSKASSDHPLSSSTNLPPQHEPNQPTTSPPTTASSSPNPSNSSSSSSPTNTSNQIPSAIPSPDSDNFIETLQATPNMPSHPNGRASSIRSISNPLFLLGAKLRVTRRKTNDQPTLNRKASIASLADTSKPIIPPITSPSSLNPSPQPNTLPSSPPPNSSGSFQLKSFRNVRTSSAPGTSLETSPNPSSTSTPSTPVPASVPLARPAPSSQTLPNESSKPSDNNGRPSRSRPVSPSPGPGPRISAAAFREARAARTTSRTSFSSSYSDLSLAYDPKDRLSVCIPSQHSRFLSQPSPARAMSDLGHSHHGSATPTPKRKPDSKRIAKQPLINQIPSRHDPAGVAPSPSKTLQNLGVPTSNEHELDVLIPPRPAFYGSRPGPRIVSKPAGDRPVSTAVHSSPGFYRHGSAQGSHSSIRSLPVPSSKSSVRPASVHHQPLTPARTQTDLNLDKWHSDDDEEEDAPLNRFLPAQSVTSALSSAVSKPNTHSRKNSSVSISVPPLSVPSNPTLNHPSQKPNTSEDDEEDEVPLSRLKKKSHSSLRETSQQHARSDSNQSLIPPLPSTSSASSSAENGLPRSPLRSPITVNDTSPNRRSSLTPSYSSRASSSRHSHMVPGRSLSNLAFGSADAHRLPPLLSVASVPSSGAPSAIHTIFGHRGNSPASSSSGSGTWSQPATPQDSSAAINTHGVGPAARARVTFEPGLSHNPEGRRGPLLPHNTSADADPSLHHLNLPNPAAIDKPWTRRSMSADHLVDSAHLGNRGSHPSMNQFYGNNSSLGSQHLGE